MKNVILMLLFFTVAPENCRIEVMTKLINDKFLKIKLINSNNEPVYFFYGQSINNFKIMDDINEIEPKNILSISSEEDYLDYQFDFSRSLINKTKKRYSIPFDEAVMYLHYKKNYIIVPANQCKTLDLEVLKRNYTAIYNLDSTKSYYLTAEIKFQNIYIPDFVKDSLQKKNIDIINPNIKIEKIKIDIKKFFRKKNGYYKIR